MNENPSFGAFADVFDFSREKKFQGRHFLNGENEAVWYDYRLRSSINVAKEKYGVSKIEDSAELKALMEFRGAGGSNADNHENPLPTKRKAIYILCTELSNISHFSRFVFWFYELVSSEWFVNFVKRER